MMVSDGDWELVGHNLHSGVSTWRLDVGDGYVFKTVSESAGDILDENRTLRNMASSGWSGDYHLIGKVPLNLLHDGALRGAAIDGDDEYVKRWLSNSDNSGWRTKDGRL
jgi:hypothetical protein